MKIILVRHGDYTPASEDPNEGLSSQGIKEVQALLARLKDQKIFFDTIYSSPKARAKQTAEILAEGKTVTVTEMLKGDAKPRELKDYLTGETGTVLVVGHNPFMGVLADLYGANVHFHTAGCIIIENELYSSL